MITKNYNYQTMRDIEKNNMEYLNIPRTSLAIGSVLARALRGAPSDVIDTSDTFEESDLDESNFETIPYMEDHIDALNVMEHSRKSMSDKLKAAAAKLASAVAGSAQEEPAEPPA